MRIRINNKLAIFLGLSSKRQNAKSNKVQIGGSKLIFRDKPRPARTAKQKIIIKVVRLNLRMIDSSCHNRGKKLIAYGLLEG